MFYFIFCRKIHSELAVQLQGGSEVTGSCNPRPEEVGLTQPKTHLSAHLYSIQKYLPLMLPHAGIPDKSPVRGGCKVLPIPDGKGIEEFDPDLLD